jgi:hypothetical protein
MTGATVIGIQAMRAAGTRKRNAIGASSPSAKKEPRRDRRRYQKKKC